jgi:isopenicillin N synthase-like dioxygenase
VVADIKKCEDLKESLTTGYDPYVDPLGVGDAMPEILRRHNLWPNPEYAPKLKPSVEAYRAACLKLMRQLVRVVAVAIGEKEDFFEKKITYPIAGIRALYYPPQEAPGEEETGLGAHTDVQRKASSHNGRSQIEAYTLRSDDYDCSKAI